MKIKISKQFWIDHIPMVVAGQKYNPMHDWMNWLDDNDMDWYIVNVIDLDDSGGCTIEIENEDDASLFILTWL